MRFLPELTLLVGAPCVFVLPSPALAQETVIFTYDALGRLVTVENAGGPNDQATTQYDYDKAGNRIRLEVNDDGGDGESGGAQSEMQELVLRFDGRFMAVVNQ